MDSSEQAEAASRHGSDYELFAALASEGRELEGGFWPIFVACAWVGSRSEEFTAAAQAFGREKRIDLHGLSASCAWALLSEVMHERFGVTMSQAVQGIKSAIGDGSLPPGWGHDQRTGHDRAIAPAEWLRALPPPSLSGAIVPGVSGVSWSSADLRAAFKIETEPGSSEEVAPPAAVVHSGVRPYMRLADAPPQVKDWLAQAIERKVPVRDVYSDAREKLGQGVLRQREAQDLLKEAMAEPVLRGRPYGRKTRITR